MEICDPEQTNFVKQFYLFLSKLNKFKTGTEKYIRLMWVLFSRLGACVCNFGALIGALFSRNNNNLS